MASSAPSFSSIKNAHQLISPYIHETPILTCETLNKISGRKLFFKCENFQKVGAFKIRGATNAVLSLDEDIAQKGVVTHSSGNHAQALACAAKLRGIPAHIIMPNNGPIVKKNATKDTYGATVHFCEPSLTARETTCSKVQSDTGAIFIHPYNDARVIAGQGTIMLESIQQLSKQYPNQDTIDGVIGPISGGGLISGIALAVHGLNESSSKKIKVLGAEPANADDAYRSKQMGSLQKHNKKVVTLADGLMAELGSITWPIVRDYVNEIYLVTEEEIIKTMKLLWERMKIIVEPSGAASAAVALFNEDFKKRTDMNSVLIIISGGNLDLDHIPWINANVLESSC